MTDNRPNTAPLRINKKKKEIDDVDDILNLIDEAENINNYKKPYEKQIERKNKEYQKINKIGYNDKLSNDLDIINFDKNISSEKKVLISNKIENISNEQKLKLNKLFSKSVNLPLNEKFNKIDK